MHDVGEPRTWYEEAMKAERGWAPRAARGFSALWISMAGGLVVGPACSKADRVQPSRDAGVTPGDPRTRCAAPIEIGAYTPQTATWFDRQTSPECPDYRITGNVVVPRGQLLDIRPAVVASVDDGVVIGADGGQITAVGTEAEPIRLTGAATAGSWRGVVLEDSPNAELVWVTIEYGGRDAPISASLETRGATTLSLEHVTVRQSVSFGLFASEQTNFAGFSSNTFTENARGPASIGVNQLRNLDSSSSFAGNEVDAIEVRGSTLTVDTTVRRVDVPFAVGDPETGALRLEADALIEAGVDLVFREGVGLHVAGRSLRVQGTAEAPARMSGLDGASWRGVFFDVGAQVAWRHVRVEGATGTPLWAPDVQTATTAASVFVLGGDPATTVALDEVTIAESGGLSLFIAAEPAAEVTCTGLSTDAPVVPACPFSSP